MWHISHFETCTLARCRDFPSDIAQHQYLVSEIDILSKFDRAEVEIRSTLDYFSTPLNIAGRLAPRDQNLTSEAGTGFSFHCLL
jgi:hypothetical protein